MVSRRPELPCAGLAGPPLGGSVCSRSGVRGPLPPWGGGGGPRTWCRRARNGVRGPRTPTRASPSPVRPAVTGSPQPRWSAGGRGGRVHRWGGPLCWRGCATRSVAEQAASRLMQAGPWMRRASPARTGAALCGQCAGVARSLRPPMGASGSSSRLRWPAGGQAGCGQSRHRRPFPEGRGAGGHSGSSVSAWTCRGRTTVKSRRFKIATVATFSRPATAITEASTPPSRRLA